MTYRGLPADYDSWKTRSDRDDDYNWDYWNEPEPVEDTMQEPYAKEIENALNHELKADFPNAPKLGLKPAVHTGIATPTSRDRIQNTIVELENLVGDLTTLIHTLNAIKSKL